MTRAALVSAALACVLLSCGRGDALPKKPRDGGAPAPVNTLAQYAGDPDAFVVVRDTELHAESPRGPVIGWLRRGASVKADLFGAPSADASKWVLVRDLAPSADEKLVAFVERSALGKAGGVPPASSPLLGSEVRATFGFLAHAWFERDRGGPLRFRRCHEVLLRDEGAIALQDLEGVELSGHNESAFAWSSSPVIHHSLVCPAHAVTRDLTELFLTTPNPAGSQAILPEPTFENPASRKSRKATSPSNPRIPTSSRRQSNAALRSTGSCKPKKDPCATPGGSLRPEGNVKASGRRSKLASSIPDRSGISTPRTLGIRQRTWKLGAIGSPSSTSTPCASAGTSA